MKTPKHARKLAFLAQDGRCIYCDLPMWLDDPAPAREATPRGSRRLRMLQATAEHLVAQRDGGSNAPRNIAAAHAICNRRRHARQIAPEPDHYRAFVRQRIARGKWFDSGTRETLRRLETSRAARR